MNYAIISFNVCLSNFSVTYIHYAFFSFYVYWLTFNCFYSTRFDIFSVNCTRNYMIGQNFD